MMNAEELSNGPLLDAMDVGASLTGHVLVRSDGRVVRVEDARLDDWVDLDGQFDEEPTFLPAEGSS